jgi:hypothetical protein
VARISRINGPRYDISISVLERVARKWRVTCRGGGPRTCRRPSLVGMTGAGSGKRSRLSWRGLVAVTRAYPSPEIDAPRGLRWRLEEEEEEGCVCVCVWGRVPEDSRDDTGFPVFAFLAVARLALRLVPRPACQTSE